MHEHRVIRLRLIHVPIEVSHVHQEAEQRLTRIPRVIPLLGKQSQLEWERVSAGPSVKWEEDVLPSVHIVRWKIYPELAVIIEGIVQVKSRWGGSNAEVITRRSQQMRDQFVDSCLFRLVDFGVGRRKVSL